MKTYGAIMTALAVNSTTLLCGLCLTQADVIGVVFMGLILAGIAVSMFCLISGVVESVKAADERDRAAVRERIRRRKGVQNIDLASWPMIDETGRII